MLKAIWKQWKVVAKRIGYLQSQLILGLMYFIVVAPFAVAVRLFSHPTRLQGNPSWQRLPQEGQSSATLTSVRQQS